VGDAFISTPVASPDGRFVAYSVYPLPKPGEAGGVDLHVMRSHGSDQRLVLAHDEPWASLSDPAWTPDSRGLYYTYRTLDARERIESVAADDGTGRKAIVEDAHGPTLSADGLVLAYITNDRETGSTVLWAAEANGSNPRQLAGPSDFLAIASPASHRGQTACVLCLALPQPQASAALGRASGSDQRWLRRWVPWDLWLLDMGDDSLRA
jgi:hypothetical protein